MKTIITILCIFGSLQGQGRFEKIMEEAAKKTDMELLGTGELADVRGVQDAIEQQQDSFDKAVGESFLRLWDRYAEEYYNDSSVSTITWFGWRKGETIYNGWSEEKIDTVWIHKAKPTPLDFIEWLNEWLKKQ